MSHTYSSTHFRKVLVPVVFECEAEAALAAGLAIAGAENILLAGFVGVEPGQSLSVGTQPARRVREALRRLGNQSRARARAGVRVSHSPWQELIAVAQEERPDLLVLEWPCHFEAFRVAPQQALAYLPCDIAIVRGPLPSPIRKVLVPLRGGPYAELALKISLAIAKTNGAELASLHLYPKDVRLLQDAPFRGIANVLAHLPEVEWREMRTENPAETILAASRRYDLAVLGASAQSAPSAAALGAVAQRVLEESPAAVVVVRTKREMPADLQSESAGQHAISVLVDKWFAENTFHADEFADLERLVALKRSQNLRISLALPALNEEKTVGTVIRTVKTALMDEHPLLDEIVLMDSDSSDRTREIAESLGVPAYVHQQVLPAYGSRCGKGEALWKSLFVTCGDILLWLDTDIVNIHPRFVYGLVGPMLINPRLQFVKGFYRRPIRVGEKIQAGGGGRVTELTARPLINLFYPELSGVVQPLSGEYGGRREALERLPFFSGYGVEIGLLIDAREKFGLRAIAQVDLEERIHHNQPLESLSKMSFAIVQAVIHRLERRYGQGMLEEVNQTMKLIRYEPGRFFLEVEEIAEKERPPMAELPEYRQLHAARLGKD